MHFTFATGAIWTVALLSILCMLLRPRGIPEYIWVVSGACLLLVSRLVPLGAAIQAIDEGLNVYLFLTGMMILSELARREEVFDWLADLALRRARGSPWKLFLLVYAVGVGVTAFLSNDATAVVLTPAVLVVARRAGARPLPYLLACALIANAASFVLPISNPANLVVYGRKLPALASWLSTFALPSIASIGTTLIALSWVCRKDFGYELSPPAGEPRQLSPSGRTATYGLLLAVVALLAASALGWSLGLPTCLVAILAMSAVGFRDRAVFFHVLKAVSWSVLPLVAGLFVIVEALNRARLHEMAEHALQLAQGMAAVPGRLLTAFGVGLVCNAMNNLPVGLATGTALQRDGFSAVIRHSVLLGVDLGPNLSVTGSLATVLWLIALRREKVSVSGWEFMKVGLVVMPITLLCSVLALWG